MGRVTGSGGVVAGQGEIGATESVRRELLADHVGRPRHAGRLECFDVEAETSNPVCGDRVLVRVRFDGQRCADVSQDVLGCSLTRASASMMSELVLGRDVGTVLDLGGRVAGLLRQPGSEVADEVADELGDAVALVGVGRYPSRVRCALLGWEALGRALGKVRCAEGASDGHPVAPSLLNG